MNEQTKDYRKIVYLSFPPDISGRPVVCNLSRLYDVCFNILKSQINPRQEGHMTMELLGSEESVSEGMRYLKENGVKITPVAQKIFKDENSCMHCGLCTSMCPTRALSVDPQTRLVVFQSESCSACGMCTKICPVKAMVVEIENGML